MINKLNQAVAFQEKAIGLRAYRQQILASNIANADTPNYKARDIDFSAALQSAMAGRAGGVEMARTYSGDQSVSEETRAHYRRVARVAENRHLGIKGLDIATQYYEMARWQRRRGNLIGGGHPAI